MTNEDGKSAGMCEQIADPLVAQAAENAAQNENPQNENNPARDDLTCRVPLRQRPPGPGRMRSLLGFPEKPPDESSQSIHQSARTYPSADLSRP
jgi:hypothetical protein